MRKATKISPCASKAGGSSTAIVVAPKRQARNSQRSIFTEVSSLKTGAFSTYQLRRNALQYLEKGIDARAEKLVLNLLQDDGYEPSQFFRRSVEHKLATGVSFLKELQPSLDRGLFHVYYGPKDIGKTTAVNLGLQGYKGVMYMSAENLENQKYFDFFQGHIQLSDFYEMFENSVKAYRRATQDVPLLVLDNVTSRISYYDMRFFEILNQKNLLDVAMITNDFGTAAKLKAENSSLTYSMFPRMSNEDLAHQLTNISAIMGAKKFNINLEPQASGWWWKKKPAPVVNPVTAFAPSVLSAADVQEIVKRIGPNMTEIMGVLSQAVHGKSVKEYIEEREDEAATKLLEKMSLMPMNVRELAIRYLAQFVSKEKEVLGVYDPFQNDNNIEKTELFESIKKCGAVDILAFTNSQERTVSISCKLVAGGYSKILSTPFKLKEYMKIKSKH